MPTIYFHGNYDRYEEHYNCLTEQILSYKTQFFNSVTIISWVFSPAIDKSLQCHAFNYLHQQRWPTVTVTTDETHHPLPHCAHIHWLVSTASVSVNGCHFFLHGGIQWHTCFIHTAMPDCPAAAICHMARKCNGILVGSSASIAIHQCPPLMPWASKIKQEALLSEQPSYFPFLFGLAARQTLDRLNQKRTVTENPFQQPIFKLPTPSKTQKVPRALQFFYFSVVLWKSNYLNFDLRVKQEYENTEGEAGEKGNAGNSQYFSRNDTPEEESQIPIYISPSSYRYIIFQLILRAKNIKDRFQLALGSN